MGGNRRQPRSIRVAEEIGGLRYQSPPATVLNQSDASTPASRAHHGKSTRTRVCQQPAQLRCTRSSASVHQAPAPSAAPAAPLPALPRSIALVRARLTRTSPTSAHPPRNTEQHAGRTSPCSGSLTPPRHSTSPNAKRPRPTLVGTRPLRVLLCVFWLSALPSVAQPLTGPVTTGIWGSSMFGFADGRGRSGMISWIWGSVRPSLFRSRFTAARADWRRRATDT